MEFQRSFPHSLIHKAESFEADQTHLLETIFSSHSFNFVV